MYIPLTRLGRAGHIIIVALRNRFASKTRPSHRSRVQVSRRRRRDQTPRQLCGVCWRGGDDRTEQKKKRVLVMESRNGRADEILWCFYCAVKQPKANVFLAAWSLGTHRRRKDANEFVSQIQHSYNKTRFYILCCCCCGF